MGRQPQLPLPTVDDAGRPTLISRFSGRWRLLSNFHPSPVQFDGHTYPTVEHAYQAAKTTDEQWRTRIRQTNSPGQAKRVGRKAPLRPGWDQLKVDVMLELLRKKFAGGLLRQQLEQTGDATLVEGNTWGDTFWGVCDGVGRNMLGRLLMQVRTENRGQ